MRRQIEVALVAVVAATVGAVAYHIVDKWPHAAGSPQPQSTSAAPRTFRIDEETIRIYGEPVPIDDGPLPLTFEITGAGQVDVTYSPDAHGKTTRTRVTAPWTVTVQAPPFTPAGAIKLTAEVTSKRADAVVYCRIVIADFAGDTFAEDFASGPHAVARC